MTRLARIASAASWLLLCGCLVSLPLWLAPVALFSAVAFHNTAERLQYR